MWQAFAGLTVVLHCTYLGFVTVGALLGLRSLRWVPFHIFCVVWAVVVVVVQGRCPITTLEKWFLTQGGETPYKGSFLDHYVFGPVFPEGLTTLVFATQMACVLLTYLILVRHLLRRRRHAGRTACKV